MITSDVELALERLNQGDIIGMPTETVYGLAADAACDAAIKKVFSVKKRPINHPLIMHVAHDWDLSAWAENIPSYVYVLIEHFWPGPLTLVLNTRPGAVNPLVTGGQDTVAIRCPAHPVAEELLVRFGRPLVAPSANLFGKISPTTAEHVLDSFKHDDLVILDGGRCRVGIESTILMATDQQGYQILRHGMIDETAIKSVISNERFNDNVNVRVPGKLASHYQPEKPLYFIHDISDLNDSSAYVNKRAYLLTFSPYQAKENEQNFQFSNHSLDVAHELYYQLRRADQSDAEVIIIELPPNTGEWQAIRERITKAGKIIQS